MNSGRLIDCDAPVFVPAGLSLIPDGEQLPNRVCGKVLFNPEKVKLYLDVGQVRFGSVIGLVLRVRLALINKHLYTSHVLDYLFSTENCHLIPEEWKGKSIYFWGTIYVGNCDGKLRVRHLFYSISSCKWEIMHTTIDSCFYGSDYAAAA